MNNLLQIAEGLRAEVNNLLLFAKMFLKAGILTGLIVLPFALYILSRFETKRKIAGRR